MSIKRLFVMLLFAAVCRAAAADDWPQWRGPRRDGVSAEKLTLAAWPEQGAATIVWRFDIGKGHANVSVVGDRGYTAGWDGKQDTIYCLDLVNGKTLWKQSYPCETLVQWPGPRGTPTVDGDTVYTLGQHGQLHAWNARTGEMRWKKQLSKKAEPDVDYGYAWSPLIAGDLLILPVGKTGLALNKHDGSTVWGGDEGKGACASPTPFTHRAAGGTGASIAAVAMILTHDDRESSYLIGVDVRNGNVLWRHDRWSEKWGAIGVDLVTDGRAFFVTSSEQYKQCARLSPAATTRQGAPATLKQDWAHNKFAGYTGGVVLLEGCLYGIDTKRGGQLKCLDWSTGQEHWAQHSFGTHAGMIAADGKLIVQTSESGELVVADASAKAFHERRRMKVFQGPGRVSTFTPPVFANGRVYCRSYEGELVCVKVEK